MFLHGYNHVTISIKEPNAVGFSYQMEKLMTKLKFRSAALIAAAMFAIPAMARESHVDSRHQAVSANASTTPGAQYIGEADRFRGYKDHDIWGHWGTYYGPMLPSIP
jgi:hypothetical protein